MTRKEILKLADMVKRHNSQERNDIERFSADHIYLLANFCEECNPRFNRDRWYNYLDDANTPRPIQYTVHNVID